MNNALPSLCEEERWGGGEREKRLIDFLISIRTEASLEMDSQHPQCHRSSPYPHNLLTRGAVRVAALPSGNTISFAIIWLYAQQHF